MFGIRHRAYLLRPNLQAQIKAKPLDSLLCALRLLTVVFGFAYAIPLFGPAAQAAAYGKTLIAAAATNGLRLYQRTGPIRY